MPQRARAHTIEIDASHAIALGGAAPVARQIAAAAATATQSAWQSGLTWTLSVIPSEVGNSHVD